MRVAGSPRKTSEFLTTGQVAGYCGVNFRTVIRWIKKGMLEAQRLPGRGDHRVNRRHFVEFLAKNQLAIPPELAMNLPSPGAAILAGDQPSPAQPRVLIVDDDPITANAIQRVLKLHGFDTKTASDGFEAGRLLESFRPSLMTLDLLMQGIDGLAVLRKLNAERRLENLKVIVISADTDQKIQAALSLGASLSLKKPFGNKELVNTVKSLIGQPIETRSPGS